MSAVSDYFLARPKDVEGKNSGLLEHSLKTAHRAWELASSLGFGDIFGETAFYAGLLHDVGKLNPYYQILFSSGQVNRDYLRAHAIFSALAVNRLLNIAALPKHAQKQVIFAVAGHHSKLTQFTKSLAYIDYDKTRFERSLSGTYSNLQRFSQTVKEQEEFKILAWEKCLSKFQNIPLNESDYIADGDFVLDFLGFSSVFSALIQADRGSFWHGTDEEPERLVWEQPAFTISLNTDVLVRKGFPLSEIRMSFQEQLLSENKFEDKLAILKAPTGIGKTKIFLDIVNKAADSQRFERVFYFSPLLALTDDFEGKLFAKKGASVLDQADAEKVLVYNHAFTGSLLKKRQSKDSGVWLDAEAEDPEFFKTKEYFLRESFNKQLIITTTQRLLMVLYSNEPADKEKLVSFKNSFLIIDEVQTIPKVLLPNFTALLKALTEKYNSKILLVSATIPDELQGIAKLATPKEIEDKYLQMTAKRIEYRQDALNPAREVALLGGEGHTLFMFNTRRKARSFFEKLSLLKPDAVYLSTGIRKCDRGEIIQKRLREKEPATVVSTQVLEAGVDVSFSRMYREMAPLDNIVQAMGRLNREGERSEPVLTVFLDDDDHLPYSQLEVEESKTLIPKLHSS